MKFHLFLSTAIFVFAIIDEESNGVCLLLTEERVKSNALVCIAYGHVKLHQLGIACCAVTVQLSV